MNKNYDDEIDVDTSNYRLVRRFSKFHNLHQLTALLSLIADFHQTGEEEDILVILDTPGVVLIDEIEAKHIGCEWGEYCDEK